jgi:hypothetical protein
LPNDENWAELESVTSIKEMKKKMEGIFGYFKNAICLVGWKLQKNILNWLIAL